MEKGSVSRKQVNLKGAGEGINHAFRAAWLGTMDNQRSHFIRHSKEGSCTNENAETRIT